jgi:riboflavin synthase
MFTGIIEEVGSVERIDAAAAGARVVVRCRTVIEDAVPGASIAVNGVCLTVTTLGAGNFAADMSPETLRRSTLGELRAGAAVNLERPLAPTGRLGGHLVQGHVDGVGEVIAIEALGEGNWWLRVRVPEDLLRYVVGKGSIAIDGISLTVATIEGDRMSATVIPHTFRNTALVGRRPGDRVNLECDIIAKYVERMLGAFREPGRITAERMKELGY